MLLLKVLLTKEAYNIVLEFSKHEEIMFPHEFIFVFIPYVVGGNTINVIKGGGFGKKRRGMDW